MAPNMEEVFLQLARDIITPKFSSIKETALTAVELLQNGEKMDSMEAWEIRQTCLIPLKLALESKAKKLGFSALAGIQVMFKDERFQTSIETSDEDKLLPSQVLSVLAVSPSLAEDLQVEVIKLLLSMTITASWCTSASTIIKISQVYVGSYQSCSAMVQGAVEAALVSMISNFIARLLESERQEPMADDGDDVLADFKINYNCGSRENVVREVTSILKFLSERLETVSNVPQGWVTLPLLLEGVDRVLVKVPHSIKHNTEFQELLWKKLCPTLVVLLGQPKPEKTTNQRGSKSDSNKAIGSASASNITHSIAKVIYCIAGNLACLVGDIPLLRPVLESLFHKMLVFPLPQHKHDALRVVKELMSDPVKLVSVLGINLESRKTNLALMKMLIDTVHQCSHSNDQQLVSTSITCIDKLLASLDRISKGEAVEDLRQERNKNGKRSGQMRRGMPFNPDDDGGSELSSHVYDCQEEETRSSEKSDQSAEGAVSSSSRDMKKALTKQPSWDFENEERATAKLFVNYLKRSVPSLMQSMSIWEVDEAMQELASVFCSDQSLSLITESSNIVLNADGVYVAAIAALKLNLMLILKGFYGQDNFTPPKSETEFTNEVFSCGLLLYLPPAWLKEVYQQILSSSLLDVSLFEQKGQEKTDGLRNYLIAFLQDLEGPGTNEFKSRLMSEFREEADTEEDKTNVSDNLKVERGKHLASEVLSLVWEEILDILSVMLNDQTPVSTGSVTSRHNLALLLATDSAQEDVRRIRSSICISLNGLQRAARLCCTLGLQHLCGSAFAQLARTSCMKEDFRTSGLTEHKQQGKGSVLGMSNKSKLVRLHAAHVLSMDVVVSTGLEMGSHSADCWKHVLRCCAHISELEHTYFSQGNNQSSLPKVTHGSGVQDPQGGGDEDGSCDADLCSAPVTATVPVAPRINVPALIQQSSLESGWDNSLSAGGVLTFSQASKALCGLSQEVDSLFEDAANKLCLEALLSFLVELGEASLSQIHRLGHLGSASSSTPRPPTNALHLYRLQQVLVRVVNSSRPMIHLLRAWSTVSTFLVQATGNRDRAISKMAVTCIHEFIVSLVSQREERPHFHINEFVCKTFEDMLCLELCDGDVQDQIVCCICELVEACNSQLHSGWRPLFGALRSVKIEYTTSEAVNEARQRHVAAVMDVFDVYLDMNNITVFASATMDCVLCLLKYVHGPSTFNSDEGDAVSDNDSDLDALGDGETELESLCVPALKYLTRVCQILGRMWQMPACPVFKGAQRIQVCAAAKMVDPQVPKMNFDLFAKEFSLENYKLKEQSKLENQSSTDVRSKQMSNSVIEKSFTEDGAHLNSKSSTLSENKGEKTVTNRVSSNSAGKENDSQIPQPSEEGSCQTYSPISSTDKSLPSDDSQESSKSPLVDPSKSGSQGNQAGDTSSSSISSGVSVPAGPMGQNVDPTTLEELDNPSGVLHVWFVLMDGLVSAINYCPKSFQSHAMTTVIDLLRSSSQIPGPQFSMYCINHLLLPMIQAWLRRGSCGYRFWDTGIGSFKQCCGLVADLVVEYMSGFSTDEGYQKPLNLLLKQTMDVFIECVAQPVESISRLGCSCLRHILITAGPHLSESLWQTSANGIRRALSVSTYNLRLLMSLFHPNSENFYGDIGQVKVATRKDSTVVDGLKLRQLAKQVFLLDSQVSSMPSVHYDTEQHKSFIFLLYPPGCQDSLNPDHISTRVPFRHVVIGLLANQLLLQTIGSVLLDKNEDQKLTISSAGLPGLMKCMSTRNVYQFLSALSDIFQMAQEFDARPGLKFLLQKVAGLDVAANLYKQAAAASVFHAHSLLEICAHLDGSCMSNTKDALNPINENVDAPPIPTLADIRQLASISLGKVWTNGKLFLPLLQNLCEEMCENFLEVLQDAKKGCLLDQMSEQPIFFLTAQNDNIVTTRPKTEPVESKHSFSRKYSSSKEALQSRSSTESLGGKSLSREKSKSMDSDAGRLDEIGTATVETVQVSASSEFDSDSDEDISKILDGNRKYEGDDEVEDEKTRNRSKREIREDMESKVYTVATDQVIENLMSQYKRHKHQRSMPNFVRPPRLMRTRPKIPRKEAVDDVIDKQQKSSIMKDSEAHVQAWSDTLTAILQMTLNLPDSSFSALLPVISQLVSQLILHSTDFALRDQLTQCFNRLGQLYDFAPRPRSVSQGSSESVGRNLE